MNNGDQLHFTTQQAFNLQYITVILIILAFLVGTFSARKIDKTSVPEVVITSETELHEPLPIEARASLKSIIHYDDLFKPGTTTLLQSKAKGLALLLANHDLTAKIFTNLRFCGGEITQECFSKEMEGTRRLDDFFVKEKLPRNSFQIFYAPNLKESQAEVNFLTEAHG